MEIKRKIHNLFHPVVGRVFMLHRVIECRHQEPELRRLEITPEYLSEFVDSCLEAEFDIVSVDEIVNRVGIKKMKPFVCFTFDDGYLDTFEIAYPILKQKCIPFCVYVTRDYYRGISQPFWDEAAEMLSVEKLLRMSQDSICSIGVHTCSHPRLSELAADEQIKEIVDCKKDLEILLNKEISHIAFPHGDYNEETLRIIEGLGFKTAMTTSGLPVRDDSRLLELDRVTLIQPD